MIEQGDRVRITGVHDPAVPAALSAVGMTGTVVAVTWDYAGQDNAQTAYAKVHLDGNGPVVNYLLHDLEKLDVTDTSEFTIASLRAELEAAQQRLRDWNRDHLVDVPRLQNEIAKLHGRLAVAFEPFPPAKLITEEPPADWVIIDAKTFDSIAGRNGDQRWALARELATLRWLSVFVIAHDTTRKDNDDDGDDS